MISYLELRPLLKENPDATGSFANLSSDAVANLLTDAIRAKMPNFVMSDSTRASLADLIENVPLAKLDYFFQMIRQNNTTITACCFACFLILDFRNATRSANVPSESGDVPSEEEPTEWRPQPVAQHIN